MDLASTELVEGSISERIKLTRSGILLDPAVETGGLELLEPGAKSDEVGGSEPGDGCLDFFDGLHEGTLA